VRLSVTLFLVSFAGALFGGWLIGRWAVGVSCWSTRWR